MKNKLSFSQTNENRPWEKLLRSASLGASVLILSACASKSVDVDGSDDVYESAEVAVETVETKPKQVAAKVEEKAEAVKAEVKQAVEKVAETPKPVVEAPKVTVPKEVAEVKQQVTETVVEKTEQAEAKPKPKTAEELVASLAAKDKFEVIKEEPKAEVNASGAAAQTKKNASGLVQKALKVTRSDLPVTVGLWSLKKSTLPGNDDLIIATPTWQAGSGDYLSQVWLTLREGRLDINSSSDIDPSIRGSGIKVNGGGLIPFTRIEDNNIAVVEGDWMNELAGGGSIEILMGFFPDKAKKSPLFKSDASLDPLSRLVPTFHKLKQ